MGEGQRSARIERCYRLVRELLRGAELDRTQIAKLLGIKPAAADRHMKVIEAVVPGAAIKKHRRRRTIRIDLDAAAQPPSRSMAAAACLGASLAHLFRGSVYEHLLGKALDHILVRVRKQADFRNASRKFVFVPRGGEIALRDHHAILDELVEAVLAQHHVTIEYEHFDGRVETMEVTPWSIAIYDHQLYVIAPAAAGALQMLRLSRIRSATARAIRFEYPTPAAYDPEVVFRESFGIFIRGDYSVASVVVRLNSRWRTYANTHRWHASQVVADQSEGVIVKMRVRTCPELEAWILSFGADAEVLEHAILRDRIAERARALAARYARRRARRDARLRRSRT